jgi:hypothetical protein
MDELLPLAEARLRAARRQAGSPFGLGAAAWRDVSVSVDDELVVRMIVTDGTGTYRALDVCLFHTGDGVDVRDLETDVEDRAGAYPPGEELRGLLGAARGGPIMLDRRAPERWPARRAA